MARIHWYIVQPIKALTNIFTGVVRKRNPNALVGLIITRHLPAIFNDYLRCINKYGLVLPVTPAIHEIMPNIYDLLVINPFNKQLMKHFIQQEDKKKKKKTPQDEDFAASDNKNPTAQDYEQISNMPMVALILISMINASHCLSKDLENTAPKQDIVTIHTDDYHVKKEN